MPIKVLSRESELEERSQIFEITWWANPLSPCSVFSSVEKFEISDIDNIATTSHII